MATKKFKSDVQLEQAIKLPNKTAERALYIDSSGDLQSSTVTQTELERLSGVGSALLETDDKGAANGVASLDANGKVPSSQLPAIAITEVFSVANIAARNALTVGTGDGEVQKGDVAIVTDASNDANIISGPASYIYDGSAWQLLKAGDDVLSVNGETGIVSLDSADLDHTQVDINDWTVADGSSIAAHLDEVGSRLSDLESQPATDELLKVSANDTTVGYLEDKIVVSEGANVTNILEISTLNDGGNEDLQIQIDESKIDHDALASFVANEHINHSSVQIQTAAESGLTGGGDITTTRSLSVNIDGTTAESSADNADTILIYDDSASALKKMTRANFLAGVGVEAGDIAVTSFAFADNQSFAASVTGLAFANASIRSFVAEVSVERNTVFEHYTLVGIQKFASWDMSIEAVGDDSGLTFTITTAGQIQYTSTNTGNAGTLRFRARAIAYA